MAFTMNTMRQLKTTAENLRHLFEQNITVRFVAEPLESCDGRDEADHVHETMIAKGFDVLGLADQGRTTGYITRDGLTGGVCKEALRPLQPDELVAESTPLLDVLALFKTYKRLFVIEGNAVKYIVTQGDLQKAPVRMLLFSLVTLLEMHMLRLVRLYYPDNSWKENLKADRLESAEKVHVSRQMRNEAVDLADCLQFCDKRDLLLKHEKARGAMKLSKRKGKDFLARAESLRDNLAHGQDLVTSKGWEEIIELAEEIETLVTTFENILEPKPQTKP